MRMYTHIINTHLNSVHMCTYVRMYVLACFHSIMRSCVVWCRSKFANDGWMIEQGFMSADEESGKKWWWSKQVQDMNVVKPRTVKPADTISSALEIMNKLAVTGALIHSAVNAVVVLLGNIDEPPMEDTSG